MWWTFCHNGRQHRLALARDSRGLHVGYSGGTELLAPAPRQRLQAGQAQATGEICAPMTGKVVSLHVGVGDRVEPGTLVLSLEAMKMEYRLKAGAAGTVTAVLCKQGSLVDLGAPLVRFA